MEMQEVATKKSTLKQWRHTAVGSIDLYVYTGIVLIMFLSLFVLDGFYQQFVVEMMILAILAMSLDFLLGFAGLLNLGHALYFGTSMYSIIVLYETLNLPFLLSVLGSLVITLIIALIVGFLSCRLNGIQFTMVTLAFGQLFYTIVFKWRSVTGGSDGIRLEKPVEIHLGENLISLTGTVPLLILVSLLLILTYYILRKFSQSFFGNALTVLIGNEERAKYLGFNVFRIKLQAFVISAFFSGVAGICYLLLKLYVTPDYMNWSFSGDVLLMTLMGGMGTLFGSIGGAFILTWFKDWVSLYTDNWMLIVGSLFIIIVIFLPRGLFGWLLKKK
jgi:branched-chain amino acid transport system permease protein